MEVTLTCDHCGEESWTPMCGCCAEAEEAGILAEYVAGQLPCPACEESKVKWLALYPFLVS
jgi:hypothetical protein